MSKVGFWLKGSTGFGVHLSKKNHFFGKGTNKKPKKMHKNKKKKCIFASKFVLL